MLQATSPAADVLTRVRKLLNHRCFSLSNPNRVRSLPGAFVSANPAAFHNSDGSGYQFLVEILTDLNRRNPQLAARMIEPLIRLTRYDSERQGLMRQALEQLQGLEQLSGDLYEKITTCAERLINLNPQSACSGYRVVATMYCTLRPGSRAGESSSRQSLQ